MHSSTVAVFGMLMVLEMAPEMKGWAAAIMVMWLAQDRKRLPMRPQGLAQSNTGRCSSFRKGAPSSVMAPQQKVFATSSSALLKPMALSRSKPGWSSCSAGTRRLLTMKSAPTVHLLKANLMSKAVPRLPSSFSSSSSVKPLAFSDSWFTPGAPFSVPWPTA